MKQGFFSWITLSLLLEEKVMLLLWRVVFFPIHLIGSPTDAEYAKAAGVWFPELEIFEFVIIYIYTNRAVKN